MAPLEASRPLPTVFVGSSKDFVFLGKSDWQKRSCVDTRYLCIDTSEPMKLVLHVSMYEDSVRQLSIYLCMYVCM